MAEKLDAAPESASKVIEMHLGQQCGVSGDIHRQIVGVDFEVGVGALEIVQLFRHAEQLDEVVPFVDEVNRHAAAQCLVGAVHGTVVHAGPPVGQIA